MHFFHDSCVIVDTPNDPLLNQNACHSPVPYNKCVINNILSHAFETLEVLSLAYRSRFKALINCYSSANFINSYSLQHLDHKWLLLLDALCQ